MAGVYNGEDAPTDELHMLERQVIKFFESQGMNIQSGNIVAHHTLCRQDSKTKPAIIVQFVNGRHKTELLRQASKLKGTEVYLNKHLTKRRHCQTCTHPKETKQETSSS